MSCAYGYCPDPSGCALGGCQAEAMAYEEQRHHDDMAAQYAAEMEELAAEHYRDVHGGCGGHRSYDLTCSDCITTFREVGLI